jgi:hypothetical protein
MHLSICQISNFASDFRLGARQPNGSASEGEIDTAIRTTPASRTREHCREKPEIESEYRVVSDAI